jgi:hypothetical protein
VVEFTYLIHIKKNVNSVKEDWKITLITVTHKISYCVF